MIKLIFSYTHNKLKTGIKSRISFEKVQKVTKFNQNAWLKPYIDMNTNHRKKAKNDFETYFFQVDE